MCIFGHSEFIPIFLGQIVRKNLEWPFLAILNLYQSFWKNCVKIFRMAIFSHSKFIPVFLGKIVRKIWNGHFWPFQIYTSLLVKNCQKKFGIAIFGHSKFIPVFLGKIVRKNLEWPVLAIPNLYQPFWGKLLEKILNSHIWPFQIYTSLFGENCQKKFGTANFGYSEFISVFWGKIVRKNLEWPFLAILNFFSQFFCTDHLNRV